MVVNINSAGDGSYYSFSLDGEGYIFARVKMKDNNSGQWRIGIEKNTSSPVWGPTDFNYNQTYLIIVRYTKNPGTSPTYDDESYVWVNPPLTGEPNIAAAEASSGNGLQDYSSMSKCTGVVLNIHSGTPEWQLDDIRVGYGTTNSAAFADMNYDNTMPVELASFNAKALKNDVILSWKTATETNNFGFEIERITITGHPEQPRATPLGGAEGAPKGDWIKIGFVEGSGTTNAPKSYSFTDKSASGKTLYRLKQIDRDGKFEYSQTVEVTAVSAPQEFGLEQNYPNPFNPSTAISYQLSANGFTSLKVYDALGREVSTLVNEVKDAGTYSAQFDGTKLSSGVYVARLTSNGKSQMRKLLLMK